MHALVSIFEESPADRVRRYLELADRTRERAERIDAPELRLCYLRIAQGWEELAYETEKECHPYWEKAPGLDLHSTI